MKDERKEKEISRKEMMDAINRTTKEREFKGNIFFLNKCKSRETMNSLSNIFAAIRRFYITPRYAPPRINKI